MIYDSDDYECLVRDGLRWFVHKSFLDRFPVPCPADPCADSLPEGHRLLQKKSGRSTVYIGAGGGDHGDIVVKQYLPRSWVEYLKYLLVRTRASAEWRTGHLLRENGVPTPLTLAYGEKRIAGVWKKSVLILESVLPGITLYDYLRKASEQEDKRFIVEELATYVAQLHQAGLYYRDLHSENILIRTGPDARPHVCFIDLHEVRRVGCIKRRMCIDDLGRLNAYTLTTFGNRVRFLRTYLKQRGLLEQGWRTWAVDIDRRARALWDRHYRKRGNRIDAY